MLSEVERRVSDFVTAMEGVYRRYDNSKFFFVFEAKRIAELEQQRFTLLDEVREIDTGTGQPVTLSISIGVADRIAASETACSWCWAGEAIRRWSSGVQTTPSTAASAR